MFEPIQKFFFQIWNSLQIISGIVSSQTNSLIQKYPDQSFKLFWMYNYYSVVIGEFLKKYGWQAVPFSMPIEDVFFARFSHYNLTPAEQPMKFHLYFEHSQTRIQDNQPNMMHLYKTPDYTLCGFTLPEDVQKTPIQSRAKFINVIFSNESTREPLTVKLDKSYFQVGNEVLTAAHVLLLLNSVYPPSKFVFDTKYELKIMDGAFNLVVLKSNEWIKFDDSVLGYVRMTA